MSKYFENEINEENILLDETLKSEFQKQSFFSKLKYSLKKKNNLHKYYLKPFQGYSPHGIFKETNKVNNTKFNYLTFIFVFLYYEFSDFSNFYYLLLTLTQFYPPLSVGFKISYIFPLAVILLFRALEELFQHLRILNRDKEANNNLYPIKTKLSQTGYLLRKSKDIKVGDIIKIVDKLVPVDIIILASKFFNK